MNGTPLVKGLLQGVEDEALPGGHIGEIVPPTLPAYGEVRSR